MWALVGPKETISKRERGREPLQMKLESFLNPQYLARNPMEHNNCLHECVWCAHLNGIKAVKIFIHYRRRYLEST